MTVTSQSLQRTLSGMAPFDRLPGSAIANLTQSGQLLRYRIGQPIVRPEALPQLVLITEGQARLLGEDPPHRQTRDPAVAGGGGAAGGGRHVARSALRNGDRLL